MNDFYRGHTNDRKYHFTYIPSHFITMFPLMLRNYFKGYAIIQLLQNEMYESQQYCFRSTVQCATSVAGFVIFSMAVLRCNVMQTMILQAIYDSFCKYVI